MLTMISSFSPVSGRVGTEVTVTGVNFSRVNEYNGVIVNGMEAKVTSCSRNESKIPDADVAGGQLQHMHCQYAAIQSPPAINLTIPHHGRDFRICRFE